MKFEGLVSPKLQKDFFFSLASAGFSFWFNLPGFSDSAPVTTMCLLLILVQRYTAKSSYQMC